jgi:hypothetical protein
VGARLARDRGRDPRRARLEVVREITAFDPVELTEAVDDAPAGARGGVLELRDGSTAMVEITSPKLDSAARIVFVPLAKLRRLG